MAVNVEDEMGMRGSPFESSVEKMNVDCSTGVGLGRRIMKHEGMNRFLVRQVDG